jgi:hypothetical protein
MILSPAERKKKIIIVGGGFAGIEAAKHLGRLPVDVTVLDRRSHFTFQPLLYQAALAVLSPSDITRPIRSILARHRNVEVLMEEVTDISRSDRSITLRDGSSLSYDYLILATGSRSSYFGHEEWGQFAPSLKSISDAVAVRTQILVAFERAEILASKGMPPPDIHFVIIGGGPTGVELAGAIADITHHVLNRDFQHIRPQDAKISLYEGGPSILAAFPIALGALSALPIDLRVLSDHQRLPRQLHKARHRNHSVAVSLAVAANVSRDFVISPWFHAFNHSQGRFDVRARGTYLTSQSPGHEQALAPRVFHLNRPAIAARIFDLKRHAIVQALVSRIFHLNHHSAEQVFAPWVIHLNRRDLATRIFHLNHHVIGQCLALNHFFSKLR